MRLIQGEYRGVGFKSGDNGWGEGLELVMIEKKGRDTNNNRLLVAANGASELLLLGRDGLVNVHDEDDQVGFLNGHSGLLVDIRGPLG